MQGEVHADVIGKPLPSLVDFEGFVTLADAARWAKVLSERRMAGFSQQEVNSLEEMFKHYDKEKEMMERSKGVDLFSTYY